MSELTFKKMNAGYYNIMLNGEKIGFAIKAGSTATWYAYNNDKTISTMARNRNNAAYALLGKITI